MSSDGSKNDYDGYTGTTQNPYANVDPNLFARRAQKAPDYLDYNIKGREWTSNAFYNTGVMYLAGILAGGTYGFVEGFRSAPSSKPRIVVNSILNKSGRFGSRLGNAMAVVAITYSTIELGVEYSELVPQSAANLATPVVCASLTGLFYKSSKGPRTMIVAGGMGAAAALAGYAYRRVVPRGGGSHRLLFL